MTYVSAMSDLHHLVLILAQVLMKSADCLTGMRASGRHCLSVCVQFNWHRQEVYHSLRIILTAVNTIRSRYGSMKFSPLAKRCFEITIYLPIFYEGPKVALWSPLALLIAAKLICSSDALATFGLRESPAHEVGVGEFTG